MSVTGDFTTLDQMIAYFQGLGNLSKTRGVEEATRAIEGVARGQYAAGQGPDGQSWPRNKDGSIPLQGPTREIRFIAKNGQMRITAPDVLQYHMEKRPTLPTGNALPAPWDAAATKAIEKTLEDAAPKKR